MPGPDRSARMVLPTLIGGDNDRHG